MDTLIAVSTILFFLSTEVTSKEAADNLINQSQPLLSHFPEKAEFVTSGNVEISHIFSTTTSMGIRWEFNNYTVNGTIEAVFVGWDLKYGRFVSNRLHGFADEFEFTHLQSDTSYLICVEILERVSARLISHVECTKLSTIAPMRVDSIVVLLLVLGYFVLMPVLGCLLWRRKLAKLGGGGSSGHEVGANYGHDRKVMRWKDIEERIVLNQDS